jgi:hypothetical protein
MGITSPEIQHLFNFYYEDYRTKVWGILFFSRWDGPLKLQPEEVESVEMMSLNEIFDRYARGEKIPPDSMVAMTKFKELDLLK